MSLARNMAAVGQGATAAFEEVSVTNLRTNLMFRAKIEPIADKDLNTEFGRDARASHWLHVRDRAMDIQTMDKLSAIGGKFMVLPDGAPDNAASLHLKFTMMQGVPGKDDWA